MTRPWWGREARPLEGRAPLRGRGAGLTPEPELAPSDRRRIAAEASGRIAAYTPEWTGRQKGDPGVALLQLFAELAEPVVKRLDMLPQKSLVEFLNVAGATPAAATPAEALVEFTLSEGAPQSVQVPAGFQMGAAPATGEGELVVFETEFSIFAAPSKIAKVYVQEGGLFAEVDHKGGEPFRAFGDRPRPGRALLVGLSGATAPGPFLSLGFGMATTGRAPAPAAAGGVEPVAAAAPPALRWEVADAGTFLPAEVVRDETAGLLRGGVVELRVPRTWRPGPPEGLEDEDKSLRWLRVRIAFGQYAESPQLSLLRLNVARARAARTIRDEVLEQVAGSGGTQLRLAQTPVIPDTLVLEVDDGGLLTDLDLGESAADEDSPANGEAEAGDGEAGAFGRRWRLVQSLADAGPGDEVFTLDPETGVVTFGDGVHGAQLPKGFRNVRARSYRVGGGAAGAVAAEEIKTLLSSAPFVTGATNPLPAAGGTDRESQREALARGPQEFRARGRAVTVADYALAARSAPGAEVRRAHAVSGHHPALQGRPVPGIVGLYVVPPDRGTGRPPTPDEASLAAVARHLAATLAPAGVEVVAAAPRYHEVRALVGLVVDPSVSDASRVIRRALEELDTYLHPLKGGEAGDGWPFGGTLRHVVLLRRLLAGVPGVLAVPRLNLIVDGRRVLGCTDFTPAPHALLWPSGHEVVVQDREGER